MVGLSASSPLLRSLLLLALCRGAESVRQTVPEEHETSGMSFLVFMAAVMMVGFILGMMVAGQGRELPAEVEQPAELELQPEKQLKDVGVQTDEQVVTVEKEVAPDAVWICRARGQSYHRGDCRCLWDGGAFRGSKMDRCRVCHR